MSATAPLKPTIVPTDGMILREDTRLEPGVYYLPAGIRIAADHVTLDGNGAVIIGDSRTGTGVSVDGHDHVTIRNVRIRDFYHGITVRECKHPTLDGNQISSTAEVPANTIFLNIWLPADEAYGGGILLDRVEGGEIVGNDLQHQMNGLLCYGCRQIHVRRNNASYCSGYGIHLFETSDSVFEENWADYCNRYQPRDISDANPNGIVGQGSIGHMGADATGFLILQNSCRNVFRRNFARCGGDGFFLAGRSPDGEDVGCNDNLFEFNDGSLSPNIAFEATFSSGNIFRNNWADRCNYGFWLGYSSRNVLENNRMLYNRQAGIAVEHGVDFEVRGNDFQENGHGILIWTRLIPSFLDDARNNGTSQRWLIERNRFFRNGYGIAIRADRDHGIRPVEPEIAGRVKLRPVDHTLRENDIQDNRVGIHLHKCDRTRIERNKINKNVEADIRAEDDADTVIGHNLGLRGAYL